MTNDEIVSTLELVLGVPIDQIVGTVRQLKQSCETPNRMELFYGGELTTAYVRPDGVVILQTVQRV